MSKTTDDILRASDCHHGKFSEVFVKNPTTGLFEATGKYRCAICKQLCKVVEYLVEEK